MRQIRRVVQQPCAKLDASKAKKQQPQAAATTRFQKETRAQVDSKQNGKRDAR